MLLGVKKIKKTPSWMDVNGDWIWRVWRGEYDKKVFGEILKKIKKKKLNL